METHGLASLALALALVGCASTELEVMRPGTTEVAARLHVSAFGRACLVVEQRPTTGHLNVMVEQDGTSDWSVSRLLGWVADVAGGVFGGERRAREQAKPSSSSGCAGVLVP